MTPQFKFTIVKPTAILQALSSWINVDDGNDEWTLGENPTFHFDLDDQQSDILAGPIEEGLPGIYNIEIDIDVDETGASNDITIELYLQRADHTFIVFDTVVSSVTGPQTISIALDCGDEIPEFFAIRANVGTAGGAFTRDLTITAAEVVAEGSEIQIREPIGWKDAILKLERDPKFKSLIKFFEMPLELYGSGLVTVRNLEAIHGLDYKIGKRVEILFDPTVGYELLFDGIIDISPIDEKFIADTPYRAKLALIREDLWSRLMNNKDTPVDVQSDEDLSGDEVDVLTAKTLNLPSQKLRYEGEYNRVKTAWIASGVTVKKLVIIDFDNVVRDDIKKYELSVSDFAEDASFGTLVEELAVVPGLVPALWDGYYTIDLRIEAGNFSAGNWINFTDDTEFYIGVAGRPNTGISLHEFNNYTKLTQTPVDNGGQFLHVYEFTGTFKLKKGEKLAIFAYHDDNTGDLNIFGSRLNAWKTNCKVATTENVVLAGAQTIDGVSCVAGDRILVKDQDDPTENGIWAIDAGPSWTRTGDADASAELENATVYVEEGDLWAGTNWIQETQDVVLGTSELEFVLTDHNDTKTTAYPGVSTPDTHLIITADTTFRNTTAEGFLIHDLFKSIIDRIAGVNKFYSSFFGNTSEVASTIGEYTVQGSGFPYMVLKGLHLKGHAMSAKKLFHSLLEAFDNLAPILNIGLGYTTIDGQSAIEVEKLEDFFDSSSNSVDFYNVDRMSRRYDLERQFRKVEVGYKTGKSDTISAADDPHRIATYATKLSRTGKDIPLVSNYIAAPTLIEETRRQSIEKSKDYKLDDETFIIALNPTPVDTNTFTPELDENFDNITGIQNPESKYNFRLWPVWNLIRNMNWLNGCLQKYATSVYRFVKGEGNYAASAEMDPASEDLLTGQPAIAQNGNIQVNISSSRGQHIMSDEVYECEIPVSWEQFKAIDNNRKKSIGISRTSAATVPYFIHSMAWLIKGGKATFIVSPKDSQVSAAEAEEEVFLILETGDYILQEVTGDKIKLES